MLQQWEGGAEITIITKTFLIAKENFAHALQSPLWKALQEKRR